MDRGIRIGGRIVFAVVAYGLVARAARAADDDIDSVLREAGKVRYQQYCTTCHGADGAPGPGSKSDLRTYVARHGGKFPAADWLAIVAETRPASPHAPVWERIRNDQLNTSGEAAARGIVGQIARYVMSIQSK